MKKSFTLYILLGVFLSLGVLQAQDDEDKKKKKEKEVERPKDSGVADYDNFKNNSFDVLDESKSLLENVTHIDNEIKGYSGVMNTIGKEKLMKNLSAIKDSKSTVETLLKKIGELSKTGQELLTNVKSVSPKTKSLSASKNTKTSNSGLDTSKGHLKDIIHLLVADLKLITDELKSRGEVIE